ncbi:hypothetical protein L195_g047557 [Trifolium pratense]|uniref:Uncharacterized protein n=1 Tax=Trifolium pratense TaxID=57577 RepID=A0A2K3MKX3_TRIPR|nr:hypothetical protein L195_g047557 [Trifolium pratense]
MQSEVREKCNGIRRSQEEVQCNQKKKSERSTMQSEEAKEKYNAIRRRSQREVQCNQKKPGSNAT